MTDQQQRGHPVGPMAAGRSLDALVGRTLFGIKKLYDHDGQPWNGKNEFPQLIPSGKPWRTHSIDAKTLPWFSSEIGAAMTVFEAAVEMTGAGSIEADMEDARGEGFIVTVRFGLDAPWTCTGPLPLAVCRAALSATAGPTPAGSE